jgi:hypothetical protein
VIRARLLLEVHEAVFIRVLKVIRDKGLLDGKTVGVDCKTGGARRTLVRGIEKFNKRYIISSMAHNPERLMRGLLWGGAPRG